MLIAACDPGKIRDSFAFVVIEPQADYFIVKAAKRWLGRDYMDIEKQIAKYHVKHNFDHIVVEQNKIIMVLNTDIHLKYITIYQFLKENILK